MAITHATAKGICNSLPTPPSKNGGMRLSHFQKFDDKKLGIIAVYQSLGETLSIIKFDYGHDAIDDGILDEFFRIAV
jgi:hypothetical protein